MDKRRAAFAFVLAGAIVLIALGMKAALGAWLRLS